MKYTPTLGLKKPELTDPASILDINYNADVIDNAIVQTIGSPGSDSNIPSEKAVRSAISTAAPWNDPRWGPCNGITELDLSSKSSSSWYPVVLSNINGVRRIFVHIFRPDYQDADRPSMDMMFSVTPMSWWESEGWLDLLYGVRENVRLVSGVGVIYVHYYTVLYLRGYCKYYLYTNATVANLSTLGEEYAIGQPSDSAYIKLKIQTDPNSTPPYDNNPDAQYPADLHWAILPAAKTKLLMSIATPTTSVHAFRFGINCANPQYSLQLGTDSAAKPATSTWTVASDVRLKSEVRDADLDRCLQIVKELPLRRFAWRDDAMPLGVAGDRHKIGWISDDVQRFFPKAVDVAPFRQEKYRKTKSPDGAEEYIPDGAVEIPDCKYMNTDQIIAALYGAVQKLIQIVEQQQKEIENLKSRLTTKEIKGV